MYTNFAQLISSLNEGVVPRMALAAAHDPHSVEAAVTAQKKGLVELTLVGNPKKIQPLVRESGAIYAQIDLVTADDDAECAAQAVALIQKGYADFLMKGSLATSTLLKAVLNKENGIRKSSLMSHITILEMPSYHKLLAVSDAGMIPHPTLEEKKLILHSALVFLQQLGYEKPRAAILAAAETVNDKAPESVEAAALADLAANGAFDICEVAGPISLDLAISKESAAIKNYNHAVAGDADLLLVPDLCCGNALCKAFIYGGQAKMAGCILGAAAPIVLLSRSASAEEKYLSIALAAASCECPA